MEVTKLEDSSNTSDTGDTLDLSNDTNVENQGLLLLRRLQQLKVLKHTNTLWLLPKE